LKHYKDFLIVGIDHGCGNIKTANTVTPTGITKLDAAPTFTKNTLFFEGSYYQIGEGHKEYLADKWQDDDNYLFTLMGIARELNREGITIIMVSHDVTASVKYASHILHIGKKVFFGAKEEYLKSDAGRVFVSERGGENNG
jgi:hypothetical protein